MELLGRRGMRFMGRSVSIILNGWWDERLAEAGIRARSKIISICWREKLEILMEQGVICKDQFCWALWWKERFES
jgi:hypothetical protein